MAGLNTVQVSMNFASGNVNYRSYPTQFTDVVNAVNPGNGPTPAAISVPLGGVIVSFAQLTKPGWAMLVNMDPTNYIEWGTYDSSTLVYNPVGIIKVGCYYPICFSPNFGSSDHPGTGSHQVDANVKFYLKAWTPDMNFPATAKARVDAFEA